jgi:hypothetical protein
MIDRLTSPSIAPMEKVHVFLRGRAEGGHDSLHIAHISFVDPNLRNLARSGDTGSPQERSCVGYGG